MKASERFSDRVADYVNYRPRYPDTLVPLLADRCGLRPIHVIDDMGSGTGFLSEPFLHNGNTVHAVEPNAPMRAAAEALYGHFPSFHSVGASAEAPGLPDASVDFVTAGQAFHWFDAGAARVSFERILRDGGWTVLIWNERPAGGDGFQAEYEALLLRHAIDYAAVDHRQIDDRRIAAFFSGGHVDLTVLDNAQVLDRDGLAGRVRSCSYVPAPGAPGHAAMMADVDALFDLHEFAGRVTIAYATKVYFGRFGS